MANNILLFASADLSEFPFCNGKRWNVILYAIYMCIIFTCSCTFNLLSFHTPSICFVAAGGITEDVYTCTQAVKAT